MSEQQDYYRTLDRDLELNLLSTQRIGKVVIPAGTQICLGQDGHFSVDATDCLWASDALMCFQDHYAIESLSKPAPVGRTPLLMEES